MAQSYSYFRKIILVVVWKLPGEWKAPGRKKCIVVVTIVQGNGDQSLNQNRAERRNVIDSSDMQFHWSQPW